MGKKVTNTTQSPKPSWLMGGNPEAIEAQEAQGQQEFVTSLQLPLKVNSPRGINVVEQYHRMGIKTLVPSKGDTLFIGTQLPPGWAKVATDHAMWSHLVDEKGRIRAAIFYKAAFYDRESFINFNTRYWVDLKVVKSGEKAHNWAVQDRATGLPIFETKINEESYCDEVLEAEAKSWLQAHYPLHQDINAYWDD